MKRILIVEDEAAIREFEAINLKRAGYTVVEAGSGEEAIDIYDCDILTKVWGTNYFAEEKIVDVNIRRLRMKIEEDPSEPKYLMTVWGMGYKWNSK